MNPVKVLPQVRMGIMKISAFGETIMGTDNDGTADGRCNMTGVFGKYFNDIIFDPGIRWGLK